MLKGLYFTAVVSQLFSFVFSEATERISTKLGHIFTYDCYLINLVWTSPGRLLPHGLGGKKNFLDWLWTFTEHISATEHDINNQKETCQSPETPLHAPNLVNFGPETAENGWRVFVHLPKFSHWETLSALPHGRYITYSRQTLPCVM